MAEDKVHRLVHLDLKGAPPKVKYFAEVFPLFEKWGATGLLVEYEDTFPYEAHLTDIAAPHAYKKTDIEELKFLADKHKLEIIPLVQCFGHMEFVLKHDKFLHLREIPSYPMALCPLNTNSLHVVKDMIDQVLKCHPQCKHFHIGADEVYHIGVCKECHKFMQRENLTKEQMFFVYVKKVLETVHSTYPKLQLIMWDDMFRMTSAEVIKEFNIGDLVQPMVWLYHRNLTSLPEDMWERYSQCFNNIWIASAFKGATGPNMFVTDISMHLENHRNWIKVLNSDIKSKFKCYKGCAITGWQRYDHYAVLCELFPVGLPSLAICLLTLAKGSFTEGVHKEASLDLGFTQLIPLSPFHNVGELPECFFPGASVYLGALAMLKLKEEYKKFIKNDRMRGWMSPHHIKGNYANPAHLKYFLPMAQRLLAEFESLSQYMSSAINDVFPGTDTCEEWIGNLLQPKLDHLKEIVNTTEKLIAFGAHPKQDLQKYCKQESAVRNMNQT